MLDFSIIIKDQWREFPIQSAYGSFLPEVNRAPNKSPEPRQVRPQGEQRELRPRPQQEERVQRPWQLPAPAVRMVENQGGPNHDFAVQQQLMQMNLQLHQQQLQLELLQRQMQQQQIMARVWQSPWAPRRYRDDLW